MGSQADPTTPQGTKWSALHDGGDGFSAKRRKLSELACYAVGESAEKSGHEGQVAAQQTSTRESASCHENQDNNTEKEESTGKNATDDRRDQNAHADMASKSSGDLGGQGSDVASSLGDTVEKATIDEHGHEPSTYHKRRHGDVVIVATQKARKGFVHHLCSHDLARPYVHPCRWTKKQLDALRISFSREDGTRKSTYPRG